MNTLLEQIASPENLLSAWRAVRGNIPKYRRQRSSGPDGVSLAEFERDLPAQLNSLRDMLLSERYQPAPPKRFAVPKKNGGERTLGILNVSDRVAQRAVVQAIEPLWEPVFLDCSFGFRPGLSIDQAVTCTQKLRAGGCAWVVDGDIQACFDSLDHDQLIRLLGRKVADRRVIHLVQNWLDVGLMACGTPVEARHPLAGGSERVSAFFHRSLDWALETVAEGDDPYGAARYESASFSETEIEAYGPPVSNRDGHAADMRKRYLKRMAASGLIWSASMARPAISNAGQAAMFTLSTPAGRRLLRQGAWAAGGFAGVAAAAAVCAYLMNHKAGPAPVGVLQGSPLSPLLANIYLHPFDTTLRRTKHNLVRFADDWVICCPNREAAEQAFNQAVQALARLRLKINPAKTHIRQPGEPFEWLGVLVK
jgi:RNA-directed DNA polymerase